MTWSTKNALNNWSEVGWGELICHDNDQMIWSWMSFFRFIQKPIESCGQTECLSPPTKWADGRMAERGKIKKGMPCQECWDDAGWIWIGMDFWEIRQQIRMNIMCVFFVFFLRPFFFFSGGFFFQQKQVWNSKWIWWVHLDLDLKLQNAPQKLFSKQKASITVNRFCQKVWCLRMASFFFHNLHWSDLFR